MKLVHLDNHNRQILLDMINKFDTQFFLTGTDKNYFLLYQQMQNFII